MSATETHEPIHHWFSLSYASYLVIPRLALQEMPLDWQRRFVALLEEWEATRIETPDYHVLRADPAYTHVEKYDSDDETSRDYIFTAVQDDPWANYRRGTVADARKDQP